MTTESWSCHIFSPTRHVSPPDFTNAPRTSFSTSTLIPKMPLHTFYFAFHICSAPRIALSFQRRADARHIDYITISSLAVGWLTLVEYMPGHILFFHSAGFPAVTPPLVCRHARGRVITSRPEFLPSSYLIDASPHSHTPARVPSRFISFDGLQQHAQHAAISRAFRDASFCHA